MDALSTLLRNSQHLGKTRYYSLKVAGDWAYSITSKDTIYFYVVQSGSFCIRIGEFTQKIYAGDMVMIPNAHQHVCHAEDHNGDNAKPLNKSGAAYHQDTYDQGEIGITESSTTDAHILLFECQYVQEIIQPLLSVLPPILPKHDDIPENRFTALDEAIALITRESENMRLGRLAMIDLCASIMMVECLRTYIESLPETTDNWLVALREPNLSKALTVMHDTPNYNWTTHKLAKEAGMSRSSFTQRFKNIVGVPPLTYLTEYRLRIAARHLRLQQNNIGQIGELVGYASNSTFSQAFKRIYGVSPKEYRQQYKEDNEQKMA